MTDDKQRFSCSLPLFAVASKGSKQVTPGYVSHTITAICEKAGVVTNSVRHKSRGGCTSITGGDDSRQAKSSPLFVCA